MNDTADKQNKEYIESKSIHLDLDCCPRCGEFIEVIIWGKTDCPRCGLHFECC